MENLKHIIESLLFVSSTPLSMERLRQSVPEADAKLIREALETLGKDYETRGGGFALHHVAGGYQLRTRPEYAQWIKRLHQSQPVRLSKPALETLAIIAYRQPVLRSDIEYIRGVDSGGVLKMLLEKQLIRVLGRDAEKAGRPMIYSTTKRFLEIFDLQDLSELPTLKELEELGLAKKHQEDDDFGPDDLVPALPDAAGFAEFSNRRNLAPLEPDGLKIRGSVFFAPDSEENKAEVEFAVDEDRYPEGMGDAQSNDEEADQSKDAIENENRSGSQDWEPDGAIWEEPELDREDVEDLSGDRDYGDDLDDDPQYDSRDEEFSTDYDESEDGYSTGEDPFNEDFSTDGEEDMD